MQEGARLERMRSVARRAAPAAVRDQKYAHRRPRLRRVLRYGEHLVRVRVRVGVGLGLGLGLG